MVVMHLETYMMKNPEVFVPANIKELILKEKERVPHSKEKPTIIFDVSAAFCLFYPMTFFHFCNFQPKVLKKNIEDFVEKITSCGVYLIAVVRGNQFRSLNTWFYRELYRMKYMSECWRTRFKTKFIDVVEADLSNFKYPAMSYCADNIFSQISNDNYKVFTSENLTHQYVASVAKKYNCFAVIGQDSNYVIHDCFPIYIHTNSINVETLDCYTFQKDKLCQHLQIDTYHLPLFATLCGNDIVDGKKLQFFHEKISKKGDDKFLAIANLIKYTTKDLYGHLNEILNLIMVPDINTKLLSESLDMYLKEPKEKMCTDSVHIHVQKKENLCEISQFFSRILKMKEFREGCSIENLYDLGFVPSVKLLSSLRAKIYGIILHGEKSQTVKECYFISFDQIKFSLFAPTIVDSVKPQCKHPGLIRLWTDPRSPSKNRIRWDLLCSTVSKTLNQYTLRYVPPRLLIPVLALHYLACEIPKITSFKVFEKDSEIKALLLTVISVFGDIDESDCGQRSPDYRALHLGNYFVSCCYLLEVLNQACGFVISNEESALYNYYDGALFQHIYEELKGGDHDCHKFLKGNTMLEITFYTLFDVISGTLN